MAKNPVNSFYRNNCVFSSVSYKIVNTTVYKIIKVNLQYLWLWNMNQQVHVLKSRICNAQARPLLCVYNTASFFRVSHWIVLSCILFIYMTFSSIYMAPVRSLTQSTHLINYNSYKDFYLRECLLNVHLSSIRPSTQHSLTTITTWFNNNNKWPWYGINALIRYEVNQSEYNN